MWPAQFWKWSGKQGQKIRANKAMTSSFFTYHEGQLYGEEVALATIAAEVGTPVYVYSQQALYERARAYIQGPGQAHYAIKANGNIHLLHLLASWGLGADVTSGGELFLAQQAGFAAAHIIFSGVGKTAVEIRQALAANIQAIHAESAEELFLIEQIAAEMGVIARLGLRLNPNINATTHPYISTGMSEHKFGIAISQGLELFHYAQQSPHLRPVGLAAHIGSQIRDLVPFAEAAELLVGIATELETAGIKFEYIDVGGGWGIDYQGVEAADLSITTWIQSVAKPIVAAGYELVMEPGRSIVGPAGVLLTELIRTKQQGEKLFAIVDAGMSDLIRPTLYQAYHRIQPLTTSPSSATQPYDVVGPICETGDFLAKGRPLPELQEGELLAVMDVGAYGFAMSSNYNGRLRPAEVLIEKDRFKIIRHRQTVAHLLDGC